MTPGKYNLITAIAESQPEITFKFKKRKLTPIKACERSLLKIMASSLLLLIIHDLYMAVMR